MATFYFTLASLPWLGAQPLHLDAERFLDLCSTEAEESQIQTLRAVLFGGETDDPFVGRFRAWERALRYELARLRAQKLGWPSPPLEWGEFFLTNTALAAFQKESPLEAEELLDAARIDVLDQATQASNFQWENLVAYALKLAIVLRRSARTAERGRERFVWNYQRITQSRGVQAP